MCVGIIVITIVPEVAFLSLTCIFIKIAIFVQIATPLPFKSISFVGKRLNPIYGSGIF